MRKFLLGGAVMLIVVLIATSTTSTYFAVKTYDEKKDIETEKEACEEKITLSNAGTENEDADDDADNDDDGCIPEMLTFRDEGMDVTVVYPSTWTPTLNVGLSSEVAIDDEHSLYGPVADTYKLELEVGSAKVTFSKILGGVGDLPEGLDPTVVEYDVLEDSNVSDDGTVDLVRYREIGENSWSYGVESDCNDLPDGAPAPGVEVCITHFFPGFGVNNFASQASVSNATGALLAEADAMVISAL